MSKRLFTVQISWTLLSYALPLAVALYYIPTTIANLGNERFGLLMLVTSLVGFLGVFDMGIGRSLTAALSKTRDQKSVGNFRIYAANGFLLLLLLSSVASTLLLLGRGYLVSKLEGVDAVLRMELVTSLGLVAIAIPFVFAQVAATSLLESLDRFKLISFVRAPVSALFFAVPGVMSVYTSDLACLATGIVLVRICGAIFLSASALYVSHKQLYPHQGQTLRNLISFTCMRQLAAFGGWVAVSNIVGPILVNIDRFIIAATLGASAVAVYSAPFEVISKISIVSASVATVLFAKLSRALPQSRVEAEMYFWHSIKIIASVVVPFSLCLVIFSEALLRFWLKENYAEASGFVGAVLGIGFLVHGLMQPAYVWIQAQGKPHLTALAHIGDLIMYLAYFPFLVSKFGVEGAAIAWLIRVVISFCVLHAVRLWLVRKI